MPDHAVLAIHFDDPVVELVCNQHVARLVETRNAPRPCGRRGGGRERGYGEERRGAYGCPTGGVPQRRDCRTVRTVRTAGRRVSTVLCKMPSELDSPAGRGVV